MTYLNNKSFETWTRRHLAKLENKISILITLSFCLKDIKIPRLEVQPSSQNEILISVSQNICMYCGPIFILFSDQFSFCFPLS